MVENIADRLRRGLVSAPSFGHVLALL